MKNTKEKHLNLSSSNTKGIVEYKQITTFLKERTCKLDPVKHTNNL